jgi:hypothetical protein
MRRSLWLLMLMSFWKTGECGAILMPQAAFRVKVVDEEGAPVAGARVGVTFYGSMGAGMGAGMTAHASVEKWTGTNGLCAFRGRCAASVGFSVTKSGYYGFNMDLSWPSEFTNIVMWRLQPWDVTYTAVLRRVVNPIPLYARRMDMLQAPSYDQTYGLDLMKADWVSPYGKGEVADFLVRVDCVFGEVPASGARVYDATCKIEFPNEGDGLQEVRCPWPVRAAESLLHLPRLAPEDGYSNKWEAIVYAREGRYHRPWREDDNYYFRVRTQKDEGGKIVHALYGKIYGPIEFWISTNGPLLKMTYYLNPTPNDRNLEFDPKRNLFTDLNIHEEVYRP